MEIDIFYATVSLSYSCYRKATIGPRGGLKIPTAAWVRYL